jgi:flagellum-specific peptidoglycan hydrolase FlgJ
MNHIDEVLPKIASAAAEAALATGCPKDVIAAQVIIESGWLKFAPQNNCLGIKAYAGCSGTQMLATTEWFTDAEVARFLALGNGRTAARRKDEHGNDLSKRPDGRALYDCKDLFATFPTLGDCFTKRAQMWDKGPYAKSANEYKADGDVVKFVRAMARIYATDPHYGDTILQIMNQKNVKDALAHA